MLQVGRAVDVEAGLCRRVRGPAAGLCLFPRGDGLGVRGRGGVGHGQHHAGHAADVAPLGPARQEEVLDLEQARALLDEGALDALGLAAEDIVLVCLGAQDQRRAGRVGRGRGDELDARRHLGGGQDAVVPSGGRCSGCLVAADAHEQRRVLPGHLLALDEGAERPARKDGPVALLGARRRRLFGVRRVVAPVRLRKSLERLEEGGDGRPAGGRGQVSVAGQAARDC